MAEATFGELLAEARRNKGETIEEVAEQLRIRPSIILAMETSNFSHMPHKGYARNMISSYARYLRLDSTKITEQFLREFRRWEAGGKRGGGGHISALNLATKRSASSDDPLALEQQGDEREMITAAGRNRDRSSLWGKEDNRVVDKTFRDQLRRVQDDKSTRKMALSRKGTPQRGEVESVHQKTVRTNDYVGKPPRKSIFSGISSGISNRPILLIIGLVGAFLAILILWAALASTCSQNESPNAPVTGVAASDDGLDEDQASNRVEDIEARIADDNRYGPFELVVEVVEYSSWLQIDIDGSTPIGDVLNAPWSGSYMVSSEARIQAGAPGNVKVTRNGVEVPLEHVDGLGFLELKVEERPIVQNAQNADAQSQS